MRWAAHARFGLDLDDRQSYPAAGLHMIPVHRDKVEVYVAHKDTIHAALGWKWWGDMVTAAERAERAKGVFNRLENQGTLHGLQASASYFRPDLIGGRSFSFLGMKELADDEDSSGKLVTSAFRICLDRRPILSSREMRSFGLKYEAG